MTKKAFYLTTAIDYVNAKPHIGHAFEKVLADAIARHHRQKGEKVWFLTGTDENAQKNVLAAREKKISTKKFVEENSKSFVELCKKLNISNDDFIRTTEERHKKTVQEIFKKVYEKGEIYKGKYEGLYCVGCECFVTEKDLVNGKCPEHGKKPVVLSEDAYFFKLSKYKDKIEKFVKNYIVPESRKKEILTRLKEEGLKDLCVSRTNLEWGIDSPIDKNFKVYVWFDALVNYISGANGNWPADLHVVGKGINWFHSVIWPAILLSSGYELPKKLLVHSYLNLKGEKISKSLGNVIDPLGLVKKYGADSVRYSLLKCSVFEDSDFSEEILIERHNNELANKLGNLISRVAALIEKYETEKGGYKLLKRLKEKEIEKHFENYETDKALNEIFAFIDICNEYVQEKKPWETHDKKILGELKESILKIAELLFPFIPETSEKITKQFTGKIKKQEILFKKI
ncbi:MAG TPA: methionine--tRNA ligase [Patescibacteria group bacterium]|nr:methionine--tRNA ligase [Patescibacteria group bacterium]